MKKTPIIALVDGTNLTHATFHALGGAGSSTVDLLKTIRRRVDAVAGMKNGTTTVTVVTVAFDMPATPERPNWRKQLYPAYKGQRTGRDPALDELLEAAIIGLQSEYEVLATPGVEADDLIATRWQHGIDTGCRMLLVSADRDLWQLLRPASTSQLCGFKTSGGKVTDPRYKTYSDFVTDYGFNPLQWPLFKAIAGDKSDHIPGIATLGDKAAGDICRKYSTLAEANADRWGLPLTPRQLANWDNAIADVSADVFVRLCTLDRDADLGVELPGKETPSHATNASNPS